MVHPWLYQIKGITRLRGSRRNEINRSLVCVVNYDNVYGFIFFHISAQNSKVVLSRTVSSKALITLY